MSEAVIPFFIPAATGGSTSVIRISDPAVNTEKNLLELVVISGGPVYGWTGGVTAGDAYAGTHPATNDNVEFDFAANQYHPAHFQVGNIGSMTLSSDVATVGYIRNIEQ